MTVVVRKNLKLSPRYFGPFQIIQKLEKVVYKLDLPKESKIYPVFHISCLKKKIGTQVNPNPRLPTVMENGAMAPEPEKIIERRLKKRETKQALIFWFNGREPTKKMQPELMPKSCAGHIPNSWASSSEGRGCVTRPKF
ncbi:hypothetical protein F2P56_019769 [Juglans regia]|uniref:Tf2-1-like SH3-like domain-containing protein n=1 Tax=Juglans regia TaxID=51240 RepID=A0A833THE2_JUGRE|nr:hypothetical protein F2P56_019769 [Juglans regia]